MNTASNKHLPAQAQLIVGNPQQTLQQAHHLLQEAFCSDDGCGTCITCTHISTQQHHAIMWLMPNPTYTLETLEPLFERIRCANQEQERYFFVIQQADFLTQACANRLLKIVEEPPAGYHFIFLAQRLGMVINTIRSRCIITTTDAQLAPTSAHPLATLFTQGPLDATSLIAVLDKNAPSDPENLELIDSIFAYWSQRITREAHAPAIVDCIQQALRQPPMPGSSKIFWRNVFMQFMQIVHAQKKLK